MVDTGAAITVLMKKWVDANGLGIKEKASKYISGTNGTSVKIVGMPSMTLLLALHWSWTCLTLLFAWATFAKV